MSDADLDSLAEDIKKHGQREAGFLLDGMVLDGWHRLRACQQIGLDFWTEEFTGEDPVAFVLSKNMHRRHLTAIQRAAAIVAATNWRPTGVTDRAATVAALSAGQMAQAAEVSERTIRHARAATVAGLGEEARDGKVSARQIAHIAKLPKAKREKAVQKIKAGEAPPKPKAVIASRAVEKLYEGAKAELLEIQGKYADLAEKNAELADTARELQDKLEMYEATEPDEQQKLIAQLQKKLVKAEGEIERMRVARNDVQAKNNQLIAEVKRLKRQAG